jgi:hypothetical protein
MCLIQSCFRGERGPSYLCHFSSQIMDIPNNQLSTIPYASFINCLGDNAFYNRLWAFSCLQQSIMSILLPDICSALITSNLSKELLLRSTATQANIGMRAVLPLVLQLTWSAKLQSFRSLTATLKEDYEQTMTSTYHLSIHNIFRLCQMRCVNLLSVDDNASYYWLLSGQ